MLHEPSVELGRDHSIHKKSRLGVALFFTYLTIYSGFVLLGTMWPGVLGIEFVAGQNLAVVYGMGLIILAAIMGLIYNHFCTRYEIDLNRGEES